MLLDFFNFTGARNVAKESLKVFNFFYMRRDGRNKGLNLWKWERDRYGNDMNAEEVEFDNKDILKDDFVKIVTLKVKKTENLKKLGFLVKRTEGNNPWSEKDVAEDRFVPVKKSRDNCNVYIINDVKEIFYTKEEAMEYLRNRERVEPVEDNQEKIKVKIHYRRHDGDYDGWNVWCWKRDYLDTEVEGRDYYFSNKPDSYGNYAEFYIDRSERLSKLGIIIKRNNWAERDIYINRFIDVTRVDENGELNVYLLQDEEKIVYREEDIDRSSKILKAYLSEDNRICAVLNRAIPNEDSMDDFVVMDENGREVAVDSVKNIGYKRYEIITKENLSIDKKYTLLKNNYRGCQVSIESKYDSKEFNELFNYGGDDLGLQYSKERSKFKIWSPTANKVKLCLYKNGIEEASEEVEEIEMTPAENGTWEVTVPRDLNGLYYKYKVNNYGKEREAVDIYAKAVGVNGERGAIIDLGDTNPDGWDKDRGPVLKNMEDAIIYEAHIRDLTIDENSGVEHKGKFLGIVEEGTRSKEGEKTGLSHLKDLGVTHVHVLPMFDYSGVNERTDDGKYNWGYNPENYNVPEGSYATDATDPKTRIIECKKAIKALHDKGIGVIMDVVYNHTAKTEDSNFNKMVPGYYYRKNSDDTFSNGSGCGNETSSEREMTAKMIIDSIKYWATEYHIDGFRFDLMGLHDIKLMNRIREELDKIRPNIIMYGEGWTGYGGSALPYDLRAIREHAWQLNNIGTFNDEGRDAIKGVNTKDREKDAGFVNGAIGKEELIKATIVAAVKHSQVRITPKVDKPIKTINYVSAHDNRTLWDKICCTNSGDREEERIKIDKLSTAIVLTSQGIPFIHGGEEFLRTKKGVHDSYNAGDEINKFDWYRKAKYIDVNNYYKRLIALRKEHPAFRMTTEEDIEKNIRFIDMHIPNVVAYTINNHANEDSFERIVVIFNGNIGSVKVTLPDGMWAMVLDGRKEDITNLECVKNSGLSSSGLKYNKVESNTQSYNFLNDNELWVEGRSATILADAVSVDKELSRKRKLKKIKKRVKKVDAILAISEGRSKK